MYDGFLFVFFCTAYINKHTDTELLHLTHYLTLIAKLDSFKGLNHNKWKEYLEKHGNQFANFGGNQ